MIYFYFIFMISVLISLMLLMLNFLFSKKMVKDREKKSSYECGFDSYNSSRLPYSVHFFLISMIFLIFDIELSLLFPIIMGMNLLSFSMMNVYMIFLMIFMFGLLIEWFEGSLIWKK